MALRDDPRAWILRMFELEEQIAGPEHCRRFPDGYVGDDIPLEIGERVFGIYKEKYYFTPTSLVIRNKKQFDRIVWADIQACSTEHGSGSKYSELTLVNGTKYRVRIGDLATGWQGRISQLFHQMVQDYGCRATLGPRLLTIEESFATAKLSVFPNLDPHPNLAEIRKALVALRKLTGVAEVLLRLVEEEHDGPIVDAVAIRSSLPADAFSVFAHQYGADGVIPLPAELAGHFSTRSEDENLWLIVWD